MYVGGDEIGTAAMNVYGQPPHAQHVYLPSYYQGQMTYTRKLSVICFCYTLSVFMRSNTERHRGKYYVDNTLYVHASTVAERRNRQKMCHC